MRETFIVKQFNESTLAVIEQANGIIVEYRAQGFTLTLRQLFYQFVARGLLENSPRTYKRIGGIVGDARLAGLIDWSAIEDRTRFLRDLPSWSSPASIVWACANQFRLDAWRDQPEHVEVWIEKDALVGVIDGVCNQLRVPFFACRGYPSLSELYSAGKRLARISDRQNVTILHLGDHDPSGIDMTRDIRDRLTMFAGAHAIAVKRIALNMDQVERYNPPPNFAKLTDCRAADYVARFGRDSWELDALEPQVIAGLIEEEVLARRDDLRWEGTIARECEAREDLRNVADNWRVAAHAAAAASNK